MTTMKGLGGISRKLALFSKCVASSVVGASLGANGTRACTTQYSYGQATYVFRLGPCTCYPSVQGQCIEIGCSNNSECGPSPATAISCSDGAYCNISCGACI